MIITAENNDLIHTHVMPKYKFYHKINKQKTYGEKNCIEKNSETKSVILTRIASPNTYYQNVNLGGY